ncbi:hypothetical protein BS47DRAFT_1489543 [Hydnum rufescens UP504]|uniref:Nucleolar GTP-binding protein 2 N-terminal domain-containing protein n=1 Tax=Hydnum rufescens UP504 TaxID=1448309 RepID=A0A9P6AIQ1_9AGAM|nr:hypothetical protein BS47DRAFT_1489543 [Hydnum rufescens UP504]
MPEVCDITRLDSDQRLHILETQSFGDAFGPRAHRKKPRLDVDSIEELGTIASALNPYTGLDTPGGAIDVCCACYYLSSESNTLWRYYCTDFTTNIRRILRGSRLLKCHRARLERSLSQIALAPTPQDVNQISRPLSDEQIIVNKLPIMSIGHHTGWLTRSNLDWRVSAGPSKNNSRHHPRRTVVDRSIDAFSKPLPLARSSPTSQPIPVRLARSAYVTYHELAIHSHSSSRRRSPCLSPLPTPRYTGKTRLKGDRRVTMVGVPESTDKRPDQFFYTKGKLCGVGRLNFYKRPNGRWQFYKDGGRGDLEGECFTNTSNTPAQICGSKEYWDQLVKLSNLNARTHEPTSTPPTKPRPYETTPRHDEGPNNNGPNGDASNSNAPNKDAHGNAPNEDAHGNAPNEDATHGNMQSKDNRAK